MYGAQSGNINEWSKKLGKYRMVGSGGNWTRNCSAQWLWPCAMRAHWKTDFNFLSQCGLSHNPHWINGAAKTQSEIFGLEYRSKFFLISISEILAWPGRKCCVHMKWAGGRSIVCLGTPGHVLPVKFTGLPWGGCLPSTFTAGSCNGKQMIKYKGLSGHRGKCSYFTTSS